MEPLDESEKEQRFLYVLQIRGMEREYVYNA